MLEWAARALKRIAIKAMKRFVNEKLSSGNFWRAQTLALVAVRTSNENKMSDR